jgi:hypothetical protein
MWRGCAASFEKSSRDSGRSRGIHTLAAGIRAVDAQGQEPPPGGLGWLATEYWMGQTPAQPT